MSVEGLVSARHVLSRQSVFGLTVVCKWGFPYRAGCTVCNAGILPVKSLGVPGTPYIFVYSSIGTILNSAGVLCTAGIVGWHIQALYRETTTV